MLLVVSVLLLSLHLLNTIFRITIDFCFQIKNRKRSEGRAYVMCVFVKVQCFSVVFATKKVHSLRSVYLAQGILLRVHRSGRMNV